MEIQHFVTLTAFQKSLTQHEFPIVHMLGFVEPKGTEFVFGDGDTLKPEGMRELLELNRARLVFLATCDSHLLAVMISPITNVVAAYDYVDV